jgi:PII-like signaling protein
MHNRLRLELIVERMAAKRACNILEAAGLKGYTVLPAISGFGGSTRWNRDTDMSSSGDMLVIVSIGAETQIEAALTKFETLLGNHIGVLSVSEVRVMRPERF